LREKILIFMNLKLFRKQIYNKGYCNLKILKREEKKKTEVCKKGLYKWIAKFYNIIKKLMFVSVFFATQLFACVIEVRQYF